MAKTILAVDDSASIRAMVSFTLKGAGYVVVEAVDGQDALDKAKSNNDEPLAKVKNSNSGAATVARWERFFVLGGASFVARLTRWHTFHDFSRGHLCIIECTGTGNGARSLVIVAIASTGRRSVPAHRTSSAPSPWRHP